MDSMYGLIIIALALLFVFPLHEISKAYLSYWLGDNTPKNYGRLNLNPFKHLDLIGFIFGVIFGFGIGKPVPISTGNYDDRRKGTMLVYTVPSLINILAGLMFGFIYYFVVKSELLPQNDIGVFVQVLIYQIARLNIANGIFSLLPVPPLDGNILITYFLPVKAKMVYMRNERIIQIIFMLLLVLGFVGKLINPIVNFVLPTIY